MTTIYVAVSVMYALMCLIPAAMKLSGTEKMRIAAQHLDIAWPRYRLIGVLELAAAAGVMIGVFASPAGLLAAIGMAVLLIGAVIVHLRAGDTIGDYAAALLFLAASVGYLAVWVSAAPRP
ncbi:DoxX family protein [Mycobacterium kyogaense]|uniref:DoxX family protein n=1 Tax=Mycobacterium kyogaense TaxID=2212479 RepID=UPI0013C3E65C|nr:DoxX family protein [Mycobacterium kyogaense]